MSRDSLTQLSLHEHTGFAHDGYPMVTGVPVPAGCVRDPASLVLRDERGQAMHASAEATARWADGSVKWALFTAPRMHLAGGATRQLALTTSESETSSPDATQRVVVLRQVADGLAVDTGRLRFTIHETGALVSTFESRVDGQWHTRGHALEDQVQVQHHDVTSTYHASAAPRRIEIESSTPMRAVIAVRGTHADEDGATFGPYTLRFECLADSPQLRMTHSLVFDGDPETDHLRASELTLQAVTGGDQHFAFGGDGGAESRFPRQRADFAPDFRYAELFQDSVSHWRLERWVDPANRAVFCAEGRQCDGWMELSGAAGRLAAAVGECWQNHPKSLFADSGTGLMRLGLYARRAEALNLRRYSDLVYNHTYECPSFKKFKDGEPEPWLPLPRDPAFNAHGIRKTHHMALMFDEPNPSRATLFYNRPLRLTWPASYTQRTAIAAPAGAGLQGQARAQTDAFLDLMQREMVRCGGTGYIDYFDLPHGFDVEAQRWFHDYGGFGYVNNECMPVLGFWHAWLLTGRPEALSMGMAMARHNSDIDSFYLGPHAGAGARHNVTHWADQDREARVSQPLGKRFYYYISGDRSFLDLVEVMLEMWQRQCAEPKLMETHANLPSLIITLLTVDEAGLADCDDWLRQCADALVRGIDERGTFKARYWIDATNRRIDPDPDAMPHSHLMFQMFGGAQTFAELAERYDHQPLRDALVRMARYQAQARAHRLAAEQGSDWKQSVATQDDSVNVYGSLDLFGYAYQLTGEHVFVDALQALGGRLPVYLTRQSETRYGQPNAAERLVPIGYAYPDLNAGRLEMHKKLYPLFPVDERLQTVRIAMWLHKLHGASVLGLLADASPSEAERESPRSNTPA